jgi:hypothetical protein
MYPFIHSFIYLFAYLFTYLFISGIGEKDYVSHRATTPTGADSRNIADTPEVVLRRTQSFEADEK